MYICVYEFMWFVRMDGSMNEKIFVSMHVCMCVRMNISMDVSI